MFDIDLFKLHNDDFGQEAGDIILSEFEKYYLTHLRAEDVAYRYGGHEFVLILLETSSNDIYSRLEELQEGIKQMGGLFKGKALGKIAVSFGAAFYHRSR